VPQVRLVLFWLESVMTMRKMVVLGAYKNRAGADHAVNELTSAGFETAEISILLPDDRGAATVENAKTANRKISRTK
ncbi:MAG: general stress protein, partial [Candidatus Acidiferrales bacterium]